MVAALARRPMREIELLEKACEFLAECKDLDEVKGLRDKAEALRVYASQAKDCLAAQNAAAIIKVRAERRIGEITREMQKSGGGRPSKTIGKVNGVSKSNALDAAGISQSEASRCEAIAAVPSVEFEATINEAVAKGKEVTSKELQKKGRTTQRKAKQRAAIVEAVPSTNGTADKPQWEVATGDCVAVIKNMQAASVRLVVADPPYRIGVDYGDHFDDSQPEDKFLLWCLDWSEQAARLLTDDGSLWLIVEHELGHELAHVIRHGISARGLGLTLRQTIIWYETFGVNCTSKYNRTSRTMLWFTKHSKRFVWNPEAVNRPSDRQTKYNDKRADPGGKVWDDVWGINPAIPRVPGTSKERMPDFPTQLPLDLLRPIVAAHSDPGDLVLDPFSGSGSTGCACIELGRRFVGIELSEKFAELSRKRLLIHSSKEFTNGVAT